MKTRALLVGVMGLLAISVAASCSPAPPPPAPRPASSSVTVTSAAFKHSNLTINPAEAVSGVQVMITARVTNGGAATQTYTPKLKIENPSVSSLPTYLFLRDRPIDAGATQQMSFVIAPDYAGKYLVTWEDLAGEFIITDPAPAAPGSTDVTAPDFTGTDVVTGKKITLSSFKGKVVLFNFVNYGCDPTVNNVVSSQLLAVKQLQQQRKDFVALSVFCGCCPEEVLRDFAKQNGFNWPWILDSNNLIARKYSSYVSRYGYPTLVFIDEAQNIRGSSGYLGASGLAAKINEIVGRKG